MRRTIAAVAVATTTCGLALGACGGGDDEKPAGFVESRNGLAGDSPSTTTTTQAATLDGYGECAGTLALVKATMAATNVLGITWTTASPLRSGDSSYYVLAGPYQIGLRSLPGGEVVRFVFDTRTGKQQNLTSSYVLDGADAQLVVPFTAVPDIAPWPESWTATVTTGGSDVGACTSA